MRGLFSKEPIFDGVTELLAACHELDGGDGDAVEGGVCGDDGPPDGHGEVVVELGGSEGTGDLDEEGAGVAVEGDGVGVLKIGLVVGGTDFGFESFFCGSPYFFY